MDGDAGDHRRSSAKRAMRGLGAPRPFKSLAATAVLRVWAKNRRRRHGNQAGVGKLELTSRTRSERSLDPFIGYEPL
jgi:hypothetical protein